MQDGKICSSRKIHCNGYKSFWPFSERCNFPHTPEEMWEFSSVYSCLPETATCPSGTFLIAPPSGQTCTVTSPLEQVSGRSWNFKVFWYRQQITWTPLILFSTLKNKTKVLWWCCMWFLRWLIEAGTTNTPPCWNCTQQPEMFSKRIQKLICRVCHKRTRKQNHNNAASIYRLFFFQRLLP